MMRYMRDAVTIYLIIYLMTFVTAADSSKQADELVYICRGEVASYTNDDCEEKGDVKGCYYVNGINQYKSCGWRFNGSSVNFETKQAAELVCRVLNSNGTTSSFLNVYCVETSTTTGTPATAPEPTQHNKVTAAPVMTTMGKDKGNTTAIILAAVFGTLSVVLLIAVVLIIVYFLHCKKKKSNSDVIMKVTTYSVVSPETSDSLTPAGVHMPLHLPADSDTEAGDDSCSSELHKSTHSPEDYGSDDEVSDRPESVASCSTAKPSEAEETPLRVKGPTADLEVDGEKYE